MSDATLGGERSVTRTGSAPSVTRTDSYGSVAGRGDEHKGGWRLSWGAIFAGAVIVLAVQLLLSLLGVGIGASMVDPTQGGGTPDASSYGTGAGIWWAVSYIVALIAGGYVASRLAGAFAPLDGMLQGLVTWGVALMVTVYLLSSAVGDILGGGFSMISSALPSASTIKSAAPQVTQAAGVSGASINPVQHRA